LERVVADARLRFSSSQPSSDGSYPTQCRLSDIHQQSKGRPVNIVRAPLISGVTLILLAVGFAAAATRADATWKPEYANAPQEVQDWYRSAQLTDAAQKRFGFKSCCAHSDVVKTEFRVDKTSGNDEWYWMREGQWTPVPGDVIHWGESAPDQQPTLFAIGNLPTCFYPGQGGL
jgi:hypothetical protein